ncbi:hypothetical protein A3A54_01885 [Candidatus Curtissbacteria bacterium RIFCSPLOWO2_01_FULL_39_62]|uniref:DUF1648 domain-containing protein n=2 Tax=Candidatus Curtissiibacteriota TaxID=1752717 RepID=A0A1F5G948_9BACT|nr:MAG: hypothetical protein A2775_00690 [Candidatus Curtissbacteria bacterium RIFCSPHIGHO2_01_FULL_39_57]OGD88391.1 MAG: hypothetical protein A3D04_02870 [Candidatus Curtissbacteria bacterium RIFCSPHIGHO2_02_FULL_40_16b]OGD90516.1 MAG: hypothetical protein A3E11_02580 [Candidatus Curtissbacteria bacterium RIFCSPHIGHO2_12_FULL_38_37]OGD99735.1 MAG: hypothetical protein A3J17_00255 [Candidatus Curtissbacteria bacterium RIFCSPLOWO2_02_FULL_40_11]OGE00945.1 MAG: hypothetical protein A3A54_01885 [C
MASDSRNHQSTKLGFRYEAQERISSDRLVFVVFVFFIISTLTQSALILVNWGTLPPEVPIFYSRPWGEQILARPIYLWILPIITVVFVLTNYFIALFLIQSQYFLNRVLIIFGAIIAFATLYDMTRIVGLLI